MLFEEILFIRLSVLIADNKEVDIGQWLAIYPRIATWMEMNMRMVPKEMCGWIIYRNRVTKTFIRTPTESYRNSGEEKTVPENNRTLLMTIL